MQRQGNPADSCTERVEMDQGTTPSHSGMTPQEIPDGMLNPAESRWSVRIGPNAQDAQSFGFWTSGESSSRAVSSIPVSSVEAHTEHGEPSYSALTGAAQIDPTNNFPRNLHIGRSGNQVQNGPLFLRTSSSQTVNLNPRHIGDNANVGQRPGLDLYSLSRSGIEHPLSANSSGSSSQLGEEDIGGSSSSLGGWGLSCKRKALDGTSGHSFPGASSSGLFTQAENSVWHTGPSQYTASSNLSLSTPSLGNSSNIVPPDQMTSRLGVGFRGVVASDAFPSGNTESLSRNLGRRGIPGQQQQESFDFSSSLPGEARHSNVSSLHQSHIVDYRDLRSGTPTYAENQARMFALPRNMNHFPWNGASSSGTSNRDVALGEDTIVRSIPRNNPDHPMFAPSTEVRNSVQDPASWSLAPGSTSNSASVVPSASRAGPSSSFHFAPSPTWMAPHNTPTHNPQQRLPEVAPWSLFPPLDTESAAQGGSFPLLPTGSSSLSIETGMPSGSNSHGHRRHPRRSALLLERQGSTVLGMPHSLRSLATDTEGRNRLVSEIQQVLNAMRRGENLRAEDYTFFDPFMYHGMAEMHDRHRDMRLDVDNMSYEELLALGERIGDVNTGLSEETILKVMKQHKHVCTEYSQELEPCCVCQEEYVDGDDLGTLDCGHDFHTDCIKQWLMQKNICPICKTTGLPT